MSNGLQIWDTVSVVGWRGIAWRIEKIDPFEATCTMIGDDKEHVFNIEELTPLDENEFCGECGQINCPHGRNYG